MTSFRHLLTGASINSTSALNYFVAVVFTSARVQTHVYGVALLAPRISSHKRVFRSTLAFSLFTLCTACTPTVEVKAPEKPIEINLNVKIEHHIKVEIEKDVQKSIANNPAIF